MENNNTSSRGRQQHRIELTDRYADQSVSADALTRRPTRGLPVRLPTDTRATRDPDGAPSRRLLTFSRHEGAPHTQRGGSGTIQSSSAADAGVSHTSTRETSQLPGTESHHHTREPTLALPHHDRKHSLTAAVDGLLGLLPLIGQNAPILLGYLFELPLRACLRAIAKHFGQTTIFDIHSDFDLSLLLDMKERGLLTKDQVGDRLHKCIRSSKVLQSAIPQNSAQVQHQDAFTSAVRHQRGIRLHSMGTYSWSLSSSLNSSIELETWEQSHQ